MIGNPTYGWFLGAAYGLVIGVILFLFWQIHRKHHSLLKNIGSEADDT